MPDAPDIELCRHNPQTLNETGGSFAGRAGKFGAFSIYKKIRKFPIGNFRLGKARSICHKSRSREAWPLNRPRKAWNWC